MTAAAAPAGAPLDGATTEAKAKKGKNALFMALVSGLAQEAKRKKDMEKIDERGPSQNEASVAIEVTARDAPAPLVDATPAAPSQRTPLPPSAPASSPRNIHTPSPGQYHKMLSINKLAKEEPQHQIHAKAFREKAYVGPACKVIVEAQPSIAKEDPKQVSQDSPVNVKCDDAFFAELKHRAALQTVTQSLLAENKDAAVSSVILSCHDDVSALDSKSFESEKVSVKIQSGFAEMMSRPPESVEVQPVELPIKYLDVLPDDEKKDIVITNMKEYKPPLPFDEDGKAEEKKAEMCREVTSSNAEVSLVIDDDKVEETVDVVQCPNAVKASETVDEKVKKSAKKEEESDIKAKEAASAAEEPLDPQSGLEAHDAPTESDHSTRGESTSSKATVSLVIEEDKVEETVDVVPCPNAVEAFETVDEKVEKSAKKEEESDIKAKEAASAADAPSDPPSEIKALEALTESDPNNEVSAKSAAIAKSPMTVSKVYKSKMEDDDEVRSFKSLPATFADKSHVSRRRDFKKEVLEKFGSKKSLGAVVEKKEVATGPKTAEQSVAASPQSVKSEKRNMSNLPKGQTTVVTEQAEADVDGLDELDDDVTALISIKEITISSVHGDRSTALASISSKIEHQTRKLAELEAEALRKHKEAETAATDAREALERMLDAKSKERAKKTDYSKEDQITSAVNERKAANAKGYAGLATNGGGEDYKSVTSRSKCGSVKGTLPKENERDADVSLCSTWSENSANVETKSKSKSKHEVDCDYRSVASRSTRGLARHKDANGKLVHKSSFYSEASSSQYSCSFDDSSRRNNGVASHCEDSTDVSCDNSASSSYQEDSKVSEIRRNQGKVSSTRGRHRVQSRNSTRSSRSASPVETSKTLLLPSLMSPDPPTKEKPSQERHYRSRSQPRSKTYHKSSGKNDVLFLNSKRSTNKPNHLIAYSSHRRSSETPEPSKPITAQSGISPESRVQSRHLSPTFASQGAAPMSLAGYASRNNVPAHQSQMGVSYQIGNQCKQIYQYTPNTLPSAPISLAGYTTPSNRMRPAAEHVGYYSRPNDGASTFPQTMHMQTPQQTSSYAMRPYSTGQMNSVQNRQYQQRQPGYHDAANRGRVNQYSMPSGGELL